MKLVSAYLNTIKKNPGAHIIFTLCASAAVTARIVLLLMNFVSVNVFELAVYIFCPFATLSLFWLTCTSPVRSPLWLYRVIGIYYFVSKGYDSSVSYICSEPYYSHRLWKWAWIWIKPMLVCAGLLLLHRILTYLAEKKHLRVFRIYRVLLMSLQPLFRTDRSEQKLSIFRRIALGFGCILMSVSAVMLTATAFLHLHFPSMDIEAIMFTIAYANDGYTPEMARKLMLYAIAAVAAAIVLSERLVRMSRAKKLTFICPAKKTSIAANAKYTRLAVWIIIPVFSTTALFLETDTFSYINNRMHTSTIYEQHYVEPTADRVKFPEKKKNLIYIYLESFENTYSTTESGGLQVQDMMPQLTELAKKNLNFSHNDKLGGSIVRAPSIAYTMGATIAMTSGVMLMTPLGRMRNDMGSLNSFLPSLRRLEDVLHDNGYTQLFIEGSDSNFAAYNSYVGRYETCTIFDLNTARNEGLIPKDYYQMWGFEDRKMFEYSKQQIDKLASDSQPFAVTMYTMDTHSFEEGYRCPLCDKSITNNFAAAVNCTSRQVGDFISWLSTKPYYDDTVVIITGDHIAEHVPEGIDLIEEGYERSPYNCIINASKTPSNPKNRVFSPMDMFPTTLSALGVQIKGNRLGLGTDLFSDTPTLAEELGRESFTEQIQQNSDYFNKEFWKKSEDE